MKSFIVLVSVAFLASVIFASPAKRVKRDFVDEGYDEDYYGEEAEPDYTVNWDESNFTNTICHTTDSTAPPPTTWVFFNF